MMKKVWWSQFFCQCADDPDEIYGNQAGLLCLIEPEQSLVDGLDLDAGELRGFIVIKDAGHKFIKIALFPKVQQLIYREFQGTGMQLLRDGQPDRE